MTTTLFTLVCVTSVFIHAVLFALARRREQRDDHRDWAMHLYKVPWHFLTLEQQDDIERRSTLLTSAQRPGEALCERMTALGMTVADLARRTDLSEKKVRALRSGDAAITGTIASQLSVVFGTTRHYWTALQQGHEASGR